MNIYEVIAALLLILASATSLIIFFKCLDQYVRDYAHDTRKGLDK